MAKNGIIIDVGFKGDLKNFITSVENEFSKIDFDKYINLNGSFESQANEVRKELRKLKDEIESVVDKKQTTSLDTQVNNLNSAVNILSNTLRDIYNKSDNIDKKYIKEIDNIIDSTNELTGVVKNTVGAINEISNASSNVKIVDNSEIDYLKDALKSLELLSKKMQNFDKMTYKIGSNKAKYKDFDEVIPDMSAYYKQYLDIQKQIKNINKDTNLTENQKSIEIEALNKKYAETNVVLNQLINTYVKLGGSLNDNITINKKDININSLIGIVADSFDKLQTWVSNRKATIISSLYDLGIENISDISNTIDNTNKELKYTTKGIAIPLYVSTGTNTLIKETVKILNEVQENIKNKPIECKISFISSSYKSRKNRELLEQLQSEVSNLTDGEIKTDLQKLINDINKEFNDTIKLKVSIEGANDINRQMKALREAAQEELNSGDYTIYPDIEITEETRDKLKAELYALSNNTTIDLKFGDTKTSIGNESAVLNNLLEMIGLINNAVLEKTNSFIKEYETVHEYIPKEVRTFDNLLKKLESINSLSENIVNLFVGLSGKKIDIKISTDIQENIGDLLNSMVIAIEELTKYLDTIKSLKNFNINQKVIQDLPNLANAFNLLISSLSSIPKESTNFIQSLNKLANSANLKALAKVLAASKNSINNAKNALNNNPPKNKKKPSVQSNQHDVISTQRQTSNDIDVSDRRKSYTYTDEIGTIVKVDFVPNGQPNGFDEIRTEVTNYNKIIKQAVDATIDLKKARDNLDEETRKGIPNQNLYNQYLQDEVIAQNKLDQATRRARGLARTTTDRINDSHYSSKFTMDYFRRKVDEGTQSSLSKQEERHLKNIDIIDNNSQKLFEQQTEQNIKAKNAYNELISKVKEYYELKDKQDNGKSITDKEISKFHKLEDEINNATNSLDKFMIYDNANYVKEAKIAKQEYENESLKFAKNNLFQQVDEIRDVNKYSIQFLLIIDKIKEKISNLSDSKGFYNISEEIKKAKENAENFEIVSNQDIYSKMGDISKTLYDSSGMSSKLKEKFQDLHNEYANLLDSKAPKQALDELNTKLSQFNEELHQSGYYGKSSFTKIKEKLKDAGAQFISQYLSLQDFIRYTREAIQAIIELDSALTEFKIVSNATNIQLKQISQSSYELANNLGSSTVEVLNSITSWRRLGKSIEESQILAEQSAILSTGGFMSVETSTTALTSSLQAFNLAVKDSSKLVDQFIYLGKVIALR